jgi:signal transduction histidine kinase
VGERANALRLRLQSQLLIVVIAVLSVLTITSLLVVRQTVAKQVQLQTLHAVTASVQAFDRLQTQQLIGLRRTAAMMAELPLLKAVMATDHAPTIQDASKNFWDLSGSDLLILFDRSSEVMALHASQAGFTKESAGNLLHSFGDDKQDVWFEDATGLYRVVARPIVAGSGTGERALGTMLLGQRISDAVANEIGHLTGTEVVLSSATRVIASTLQNVNRIVLATDLNTNTAPDHGHSYEVEVNGRKYEAASIPLQAGSSTVRCDMLLPLDQASAFVADLNRTIVIVAVVVAALGALLLRLVSSAITRPLERLNSAVKALATGDSGYRLNPEGSVEVVELANAFTAMRQDLSDARCRELEGERLAALGRAASSISHDLRHHLAALVANAEFLHDADSMGFNKEEVYREIQRAADEMTQLIESLVEVSREHPTLAIVEEDFANVVQHVIETVKANPDFRAHHTILHVNGDTTGSFDRQRLERALFNLLLNACQAVDVRTGQITVDLRTVGDQFECRISDNGAGILGSVQDTLFQPFVSAGKNNGTGLGLTIAKKILQDHHGDVTVESTGSSGTTFLIRFPRRASRRSEPEGLDSATVGG